MSKFYVSIGVQYANTPHSVLEHPDPDGVLLVEAADYDTARSMAFEALGDKWSMLYEDSYESFFFPHGIVGEIQFVGDKAQVKEYAE